MNYQEATGKLYEIAFGTVREVDEISPIVGVGQTEDGKTVIIGPFNIYSEYPDIYKTIKNLQEKLVSLKKEQEASPEKSREIFWSLFHLLINELLVTRYIMEFPKHSFSEKIDNVFEILQDLDDQRVVIDQITSQVKQTWKSRSEVEQVTPMVAERGLELLQRKALTSIQTS